MGLLAKHRPEEALSLPRAGALLRTFLQASIAALLFQILKDSWFPRISLIQSHIATVFFVGVTAAIAHFFVIWNRLRKLDDADRKLQVHFHHNPVPMWFVDRKNLRFLDVNDAAVAHYGYSLDEFRKMTLCDIRPAEDVPRLKTDLLTPRAGYREAGAWRHVVKDGRIIWMQVSTHLTDWKGRKALLVVAQDVTESKRNEEALRATEEMFRTAFDAAPFGMCLTGLKGRFIQANAALCRMFGYSAEELKGGAWAAITHPDDISPSREAMARLLANPEESVDLTKRYICKNGDIVWARLRISTVMSSSNEPSHWIAHIENITESKRAGEELVRAKEAAEAANRAKGEFLANMSHEIRTPMNGIMGMTELALASNLNEEQRDYLNTVRASSESLLEILNDILDFSKIEAGQFKLNPTEFELEKTLHEVIRLSAFTAHENGLELLYENRAELPERLIGDPGRLRQIVSNLLGNAVKFTPAGEVKLAVLEANVKDSTLTVHFAVSDTGIGVAPEWKDRIFEAFVQADGSNTRSHGGTGLGLAICSRLAGYMGGRIWVESEPGRGSNFHFTAQFGVPVTAAAPAPSPGSELLRGLRVLVADDCPALCRILHDCLLRWGIDPVVASSAPAALAILNEYDRLGERFDVALVDEHMQGADHLTSGGGSLFERVVKGPRISLLTSLDRGSRGSDLRVSEHYIVKPVTPPSLLGALLKAQGSRPERISPAMGILGSPAVRPLRVLIVEDNAVNQKVASRLLEKLGHSVEIAANGAQAVDAWQSQMFDLILMDIQMPVMNGYDATRAIRTGEEGTGRHTPIVALTAHALKEDRHLCMEAGMDDYLGKPIQPRELACMIERWSGGVSCEPLAS